MIHRVDLVEPLSPLGDVDARPPMSDSFYNKYGGSPAVAAIVHDFYTRIQEDSGLSSYFEDVDMTGLIAHQTNFIGKALGGPEVYEGKDLKVAYADRGIDDDAFSAVVGHLVAALEAAGVEEPDCKAILELIGSLRDQVVTGG